MTKHTELTADVADAVAALGLPSGWEVRVEIRPRRRTLGLELKPGEPVTVLVPPHTTPDRVADFIRTRRGWLARKIPEAQQLAPDFAVKEFVNGEGFALLGRSYRLRLTDDGPPTRIERRPHALGSDLFLCVRRDHPEAIRTAVINLYCDRGVNWADNGASGTSTAEASRAWTTRCATSAVAAGAPTARRNTWSAFTRRCSGSCAN